MYYEIFSLKSIKLLNFVIFANNFNVLFSNKKQKFNFQFDHKLRSLIEIISQG